MDGGRVAQFPSGGTTEPPRRVSPAAPAASTTASQPAVAGGSAAPPSALSTEEQIKVLIRRRAEEAVDAAVVDPASLSIIRVHNPVLGDAIKAAAEERHAASQRGGTDAPQQAEAGTAMKQLMELLEKEYEVQRKVRR